MGRLDVFREELPSTEVALPADAVAACPGTGEARSEELRPGLDSLNVFDARAPGDGAAVEDDTVVCASFGRDSDERTIQVVVQGSDDVVDESLWRPIVSSVRLDG
ncbi:hypothetical protein KLP28_11575 [Nocardioidaceae bacterium]|nr:hypothetical protein KLP28_11575 [Nocardioidaceae bacterium]